MRLGLPAETVEEPSENQQHFKAIEPALVSYAKGLAGEWSRLPSVGQIRWRTGALWRMIQLLPEGDKVAFSCYAWLDQDWEMQAYELLEVREWPAGDELIAILDRAKLRAERFEQKDLKRVSVEDLEGFGGTDS
jgi:hypothetical protein